jgi:hypothetical protein
MIFGDPNSGADNPEKLKPSHAAIVALVLNPVAIAIGSIAMRSMRKLREEVVSCWMSTTMLILFVPLVFLKGQNFTICYGFNWIDWLAILGAA